MRAASLPLLFLGLTTFAQRHGNVWHFGQHLSLDFSNCTPTVSTNGVNEGFEGCSSICDADGDLLFHTNGLTLWNADGDVMEGSTFVFGGGSYSQVLIVPRPGSSTLFHVLRPSLQAQGTAGLMSCTVDMTGDGGLGAIVTPWDTLYTGTATEHIAATRHANGEDIWILAHAYPANTFLAYRLTADGIDPVPVTSDAGPAFPPCNSNINARGEMRFNLTGTRLAMAGNGTGGEPDSDLLLYLRFNNATGEVSNPIELPPARGDFGVAFSADGSKLYTATWKALNFFSTDSNFIQQFDLSDPDPAAIIASRTVLYAAQIPTSFGSVKLGPDGRIYVARFAGDHLGVVQQPGQPGTACNYVHDGLDLQGGFCEFGLNNYIEYVGCGGISPLGMDDESNSPALWLLEDGGRSLRLSGAPPGVAYLFRVTDARGRWVRERRMRNGEAIDLRDQADGVYLVAPVDASAPAGLRQRVVLTGR